MANFYLDNDDLRLNIEQQSWDELFALVEPDTSDPESPRNVKEAKVLYHEFLQSLGEFIAEQIDPKAHLLDQQHPTLENGEMIDAPAMQEFIKGLSDMGAMAMPFSRHVGGYNLPWLVANAVCEMTARADVSLMTYYGFFSGIGLAFQFFAVDEGSFTADGKKITSTRFDHVIKDLVAGKTCGAMCLTEPQAGSDLGQIRTTARLDSDGYWYLNGQKIWITCGHGEHHLVLARSEDSAVSPGLKGLSLFYVPAHIEKNGTKVRNFEIGGQEKKMGQHSSVTVTLNYEDSRGELVGQRGHGFRNMLLVMNDARLLVGYEGIGLSEKAYRMAKAFAEDRFSMGKKIADHELIADYLDEMDVEIKALRCLAFNAGFHEEMANRLKSYLKVDTSLSDQDLKRKEEELKKHKWQARLATPLVKYHASEFAVRAARLTMQIMGGVGYMQEYYAEKLMRDSLILPIYEGTSQIQALMVLKDHLQYAMRNPAKFISKLASVKLEIISAKSSQERQLARLESLYYSSMQTIMTRMVADKFGDLKDKPLADWKSAFLKTWDPKTDFSFGLLHAERFCQITAKLWMSKALLQQALRIKDQKIKNERLELAARFMERAEPKIRGLIYEIEASKSSIFREQFQKKHEKKTKKNKQQIRV
ncbi:MAG: acyl-CoA dehydrogenase family protein [Myxococcales bacterium]|nr:MAG: acyl-CoA dehydrogenase family protein [Myxococcales bacterium]